MRSWLALAAATLASHSIAATTLYNYDFGPLDVTFYTQIGGSGFPAGTGHLRGQFTGDDVNGDGRIDLSELQSLFVAFQDSGTGTGSLQFGIYPPFTSSNNTSGSTSAFLYDKAAASLSFTFSASINKTTAGGNVGQGVGKGAAYYSPGANYGYLWNPTTSTLAVAAAVPEASTELQWLCGSLLFGGLATRRRSGRLSKQAEARS